MALAGTKAIPRKGSVRKGTGSNAKSRPQTHSAGSPGATGTQVKGPVGR